MLSSERTAFLTAIPLVVRHNVWRTSKGHCIRQCYDASRIEVPLTTASANEGPQRPRPRGSSLLLVGLGNPGPKFIGTRHNVGFEVANRFVARHGGTFSVRKGMQAEVAVTDVGSCTVHVVKPRTFMNLSGAAVRAAIRKTNVPQAAVLVVMDDMSLDIGRVRLRAKGSSGGHNGLKSIEAALGTREYARLKVGVGSPKLGPEAWKTHVLEKFSRAETQVLDEVVLDCMEVLDLWVEEPMIEGVISRMGTLTGGNR